jgi:Histidine kinase-, DNA gyrase B-, and HSP90-like ATPase
MTMLPKNRMKTKKFVLTCSSSVKVAGPAEKPALLFAAIALLPSKPPYMSSPSHRIPYGISPDLQEKIFQEFFRVRHHKMNDYPGLGLGLYIASQLVKRQGGRIWVDSIIEKGSVFYFALPAGDSLPG